MRRGLRDEDVRALLELPSVDVPWCIVCGTSGRSNVNKHHDPWKSETSTPDVTIPLCGFGNTSGCHELAHAGKLHFRNHEGRRQYLLTDRTVRYLTALEMDGWRDTREESWE